MVLSPAAIKKYIACRQVLAPYKAAARGRILRIVSSAFLVIPGSRDDRRLFLTLKLPVQ
jgi:hypothetical protein